LILLQFDKLLGPATANMKLFDLLKDANGEISPDELKLFFTAQKKTQEVIDMMIRIHQYACSKDSSDYAAFQC
jgi:hypothetical protein